VSRNDCGFGKTRHLRSTLCQGALSTTSELHLRDPRKSFERNFRQWCAEAIQPLSCRFTSRAKIISKFGNPHFSAHQTRHTTLRNLTNPFERRAWRRANAMSGSRPTRAKTKRGDTNRRRRAEHVWSPLQSARRSSTTPKMRAKTRTTKLQTSTMKTTTEQKT
jgi:hypothetical protein